MSVEDIDRRLDDRFALLRGGDRTAPDRHQTLLAVIDWSWNLLRDAERRALRWLSTFHDGFSLDGADAVLGHDALDEVRSLVDQSLLTVLDSGRTVRYRMLETVREFGRLQLARAGEQGPAGSAQLEWACGFALRLADDLWSPRQVEAVREVAVEENNVADALREALTRPDPWSVVRLLTALGPFWTIRGENSRVIAVAGAADVALTGWTPTDEQVDAAVSAGAVVALNTVGGELSGVPASMALLDEYGSRASSARVRGLVAVVQAQVLDDAAGTVARLVAIAERSDREAAAVARLWAAHHLENTGDPSGAIAQAELALTLVSDADGPWLAAMLHTMIATLSSQTGGFEEAVRHARAALPVLDQLDAADDAAQTRALLAVHAMSAGRLDEAEQWMSQMERTRRRSGEFGGASLSAARAEMALARGDVATGLALYRGAVEELGAIRFPGMGDATGLEPWALFGESLGVTALAVHGTTADHAAEGRRLYSTLLGKSLQVLDPQRPFMDYPVAGLVLHGLGAWGLLRGSMPPDTAVRLLVLAEQFGYTRFAPTMRPERTEALAQERAPGLATRLRAEYADRPAPRLLPEARAAIAQVPRPSLTSSGSTTAPPGA